MQLNKIVTRGKKRVGRGGGSGKGFHTSSRGQKGQKSRGHKVHILFEGFKVKKSLIRRLPMQRGRGKFKAYPKPIIINLEVLNILPANTKVNLATLIKAGIVTERDAKMYGVKILGKGKLEKKLEIQLPMSKSAANKLNA